MAWSKKRTALVITIGIMLAITSILGPLLFINYRTLDAKESLAYGLDEGIEVIDLDITATVGHLNVSFASLGGDALRIYASVTGKAGYFGDESPLRVISAVSNDTEDGGNAMFAVINFATYAPWPHYSVSKVNYSVVIEESLRARLNLSMTTGGVSVETSDGVVLEGLVLNSTVDGAVVALNNGTIVAGDIHIKTATGGTSFYWNNVTVDGSHDVSLTESSGRINAQLYQSAPLGGTVNIRAIDTLGELSIRLELSGEASASVKCGWSIGEPKVTGLGGFVGDAEHFRSANYPSSSGFNIQANSTVGNILVTGLWTP